MAWAAELEYLVRVDGCRVWADVDLDALAHNLNVVRELTGSGVATMLVVKADAYGHGAVAVAHHAVRCGVAALGVGTSAEALELRRAGIRIPILLLGTLLDEEAAEALRNDVHIGIHSSDRCRRLQELGLELGRVARVHLNVDTGMGRLGVLPERAADLLRLIRASSHLRLAGVMTHISSPRGAWDPFTATQFARFEGVLSEARAEGLLRGWIHAANSACVFTGARPLHDAVRVGISAYGVVPGNLPHTARLRPVLALRSRIVFLKDVPPGTSIGYDSTWRAPRRARVATLPTGYDDGVPWRVGNRGQVLVRGRRAPIAGAVSMDYTTIDVTAIPGAAVGDAVTLIGSQGEGRIGLEEVAAWADTIPYEVACSVGKRVVRVYRGGEGTPLPARGSAAASPREAPARPPRGSADRPGAPIPP